MSSNDFNLILTGFAGTGKTTVGRIVAHRLVRRFVDINEEIARMAHVPIVEILARRGESRFRSMEKKLCKLLSNRKRLVIATGEGTFADPENDDRLSLYGVVVCLTASPAEIERRLKNASGRTSLGTNMVSLWEKRRAVYDSIEFQVDTNRKTPEEVAQDILLLWCQLWA